MNTTLTALDLQYNQISASGAACLQEALAVNDTLTEYAGPGGPLPPLYERRANRERFLDMKGEDPSTS